MHDLALELPSLWSVLRLPQREAVDVRRRTDGRLLRPEAPMSGPPMRPASDFSELIVAVANHRDRASFAALFDHFAPRIKSYLLRLGVAAGQADDLAQETMLAVWRRAATFDPTRASAGAWVFAIARNQRIDALRRSRRDKVELDPSADPEPQPLPDSSMSGFERDQRVRAAMKLLPPEQLRVIELSFFDERPHSDIADALGLPLGTVKSRMRLAMNRLREALGDLL